MTAGETAPNPHLSRAPVTAGVSLARAGIVAVLVHGRDQDEQVMLDVAQRLDRDDAAYVLPVAATRTWYPGRYFDPLKVNQPHVDWALEAIDAAIAAAHRAGVPDERIVVGGFSQGACLVAELVARRPRPWAGAAILTGALLGAPGERPALAPVPGLPMFFGFSRFDEWITPDAAHAAVRAFTDAGARVTCEVYDDRVHHVSDRAVDGLRRLMAAGG